jgi:hypothetical protein
MAENYIYLRGKVKEPQLVQLPNILIPGGPENTYVQYARGEDLLFKIARVPNQLGMTLKIRRASFQDPPVLELPVMFQPEDLEVTVKIPGTDAAQLPPDTYFFSVAVTTREPEGDRTWVAYHGSFTIMDTPAMAPLPPTANLQVDNNLFRVLA